MKILRVLTINSKDNTNAIRNVAKQQSYLIVVLCSYFSKSKHYLASPVLALDVFQFILPFYLILSISLRFMVHILIMFQTLRSAIQENLVTFLWKMEPEYQSLSLEIFGMARTSSSATKLIYCKMAQGQCIMKYGFFISPTYDGQVDQAQFLLVIQSAVSPERIVTRKRRTQVRNY